MVDNMTRGKHDGTENLTSVDITEDINALRNRRTNDDQNPLDHKSRVDTRPDGCWGWVVVFSSFLIYVIADGIVYSFGIFYMEFLHYYKGGKGETAWVGSLLPGVSLTVGPLASIMTNKYGCRVTTIAGAIIAAAGFALSLAAPNLYFLYFSFGILSGLGFGLMYVSQKVIIEDYMYFGNRFGLATGLAACGSGFGAFIFNPLAKYLIDEYGWRWAMLIEAGIILNCIWCGLLFRPLPKQVITRRDCIEMRRGMFVLRNHKQAISSDDTDIENDMSMGNMEMRRGDDSDISTNMNTTPSQVITDDGNNVDMNITRTPHRVIHDLCSDIEMNIDTTPNQVVPGDDSVIDQDVDTAQSKMLPGDGSNVDTNIDTEQHQLLPGEDSVIGMKTDDCNDIDADIDTPTIQVILCSGSGFFTDIDTTLNQSIPSNDSETDPGDDTRPSDARAIYIDQDTDTTVNQVMSSDDSVIDTNIDTAPNQTISGDSSVIDTNIDTAPNQTIPDDSSVIDTNIDTAPNQTIPGDSSVIDTNIDTAPNQMIPGDSSVIDTNIDTAPNQTIPGDSSVIDTNIDTTSNDGGIGIYLHAIHEKGASQDSATQRMTICGVDISTYANTFTTLKQLLKNPIYQMIAISRFFTSIGFYMPFIFLMDRAVDEGVDEEMAKWLVSAIGPGDISTFGRVVFGYTADQKGLNNRKTHCQCAPSASATTSATPTLTLSSKRFNVKGVGAYNGTVASDAWVISFFILTGITNTFGRLLFGLFGYLADLREGDSLKWYNSALVICGVATILCPWCVNFPLLLVYACIFGTFIGMYGSLTPKVLHKLLGGRRLNESVGLLMMFDGFATLIGPPIAGWLYDATGSYDMSFIVAGAVVAISGAMLFFIRCVRRCVRCVRRARLAV